MVVVVAFCRQWWKSTQFFVVFWNVWKTHEMQAGVDTFCLHFDVDRGGHEDRRVVEDINRAVDSIFNRNE